MRGKCVIKLKKEDGRTICFLFLLFFLLDSVFHITRLLFYGSNVGRLFLLCVMLALSAIGFCGQRKIVFNTMDVLLGFFSAIVVLSLFCTMICGGDVSYAWASIKTGYLYLLFLPIMNYCVDRKERAETVIVFSTWIGSLLSIVASALCVLYLVLPNIFQTLSAAMYRFEMVSLISPLGITVRVMFNGVILQVFALFGGIYLFLTGHRKLLCLVAIVLNSVGVLLTYARGIIVGTVFAVVLVLFFAPCYGPNEKKNMRKLRLFAILLIVSGIAYAIRGEYSSVLHYIFQRFTGISNDNTSASDAFRSQLMDSINKKILESPLLGGGLGEHISLRDGAIEYTYQDIVIRMGLLGLILFLSPYVNMAYRYVIKTKRELIECIVFCTLTALLLAAYFNPYLVTSIGFFIYCFCIRVFSLRRVKYISEDKGCLYES